MKIRNFTPRIYQQAILNTCTKSNCLIILPTGLGKTKTAILVALNRLNLYPASKILFLTPTKPLADQIKNEFLNSTTIEDVTVLTGMTSPQKRKEIYQKSKVFIATPQTISNDIINRRINLEEFSLLCIDEAHRSTGEYDYVWTANKYYQKAKYPKIIGLTASPGSDTSKIKEVCKNLFIEEIEIRTEHDQDVKPYIQELETQYIEVKFPEKFQRIKDYLDISFKSKVKKVKELGIIRTTSELIGKKYLISLQRSIHSRISRGEKNIILWQGISLIAELIKIHHAQELLETQSIPSLHKYMKNIYEESTKTKVKATKNLARDINFKSAFILTEKLYKEKTEHPKLTKLKQILQKDISKDSKIIIFNQYRDSAEQITNELNKLKGIKAKLFVGQTKKGTTGLTQKEQLKILEDFKNRKYNVIVSTSIGEEGLDIPKVNFVIFYEPIPSAIRTIQRTGRTARQEKGKLIVLVTKKTRDEAYRWTAHHKEKRMYKILNTLKKKIKLEPLQKQTTLKQTQKKSLKIIADSREKGSSITKFLTDLNIEIETKNLYSADYMITNEIAVELKTKEDFLESIIDNRLLNQLKDLSNNYKKPLIIIQGEEDIYSLRKIHPNAIRGMLATITLSYRIPIIYTKNPKDTAELLYIIAKREQQEKQQFQLVKDKPLTMKEQQEFIIQSLPNIGPTLAKSLLKKFKTVKKIINAKPERLQKVEKIGKKKAEELRKVIDKEYKS